METLNYAKGVTLNFNLRKPQSKRATNLYAVVKLSGKQIKIPTTAKICAYLWNSKKQLPVLSDNMSDADRGNAIAVRSIIFSFQRVFADFYLYLCTQNEIVTPNEVKDYFRENVLYEFKENSSMANNGVPNVKREKKATKALEKALALYPSMRNKPVAQSTLTTYKYNLQNFIDYCKEIKRDSILMLTEKGLNDYHVYLREKGKSSKNIRNSLMVIKMMINEVIAKHPDFKTYNVKAISFKLPQAISEEGKKVELTDEEITAVKNCEGLTPKQQEYRDIFILECLTGQRASDIHCLFDKSKHEIIGDFYRILTQKESVEALVRITPEISEILNRYKDGFKYVDIRSKILAKNETIDLKLIAKKAKLNRIITYTDSKGVTHSKPLCEILSSHYGRHTFVTKMSRIMPLEKVKYLTGHKDTQALNKNYLHQTVNDRVQILNVAFNKDLESLERKSSTISSNVLNELFAYDSCICIMELAKTNNDIFHLDSTQNVIKVIKDISKMNSYPKEIGISSVSYLEQIICELSYYFRDSQLYSVFKFKEHYFGLPVDVPSTEEVEIMFAQEDIERPKRWQEIQLNEWENRYK